MTQRAGTVGTGIGTVSRRAPSAATIRDLERAPQGEPEAGGEELPASRTPRDAASATPAGGSRPRAAFSSLLPRGILYSLCVPLSICALGLPYYVLPPAERVWSPFHPFLRSSGVVGQAAGFLALAMLLFLWLYPVRKRYRQLSWSGSLSRWLDCHVLAGLLVPLVAAIHASWRFTGLIGLGYGAMVLVSLSGVVGRFLYVRIPRSRTGLELTREEAAAERLRLIGNLIESTGLSSARILDLLRPSPPPGRGEALARTLLRFALDDLNRRRAVRSLISEWRCARGSAAPDRGTLAQIRRLARREMALSQQIRLLDETNRIFRLWHAAHRPVAVTVMLAVLVHAAVAVAFGATWIG